MTHEMQPLDTAVYTSSGKICVTVTCLQSHAWKVTTKYQFSQKHDYIKTMISANIISGLMTCGVYPFNPKAVLDHDPCVSDVQIQILVMVIYQVGSSPLMVEDHLQQLNDGNGSCNIMDEDRIEPFMAEEKILY